MSAVPQLVDQDDRDQIVATALDDTLVVEAAAGTGKTTQLVQRIVRVIATDRAKVTEIVAVTFTEKAAGELKLRLREALEEARGAATADARERERLDQALARLEEAQVSTIHGFCADLLRERPVESGVDPLFAVLTEAQATRMYNVAFDAWFQEQLVNPPAGVERSLRRSTFGGFGAGRVSDDTPVDRLRRAGFELTQWRDFADDWQRAPFDREGRIDELVRQLHDFAELLNEPTSPHDNLHQDTRPATQLSEEIRRTEDVRPRDYNRLEAALIEVGRNRQFQRARKGTGRAYRPGVAREDVWRAREGLQHALARFEVDANADLAALLHRELRDCLARYQEAKAKAGALDFLDLLLKARDLMRSNAEVRQGFQQRFKRILVDEFQDTDPLQAEILLLLAADDPSTTDWRQVRPIPGKLFLVGDPKQSIYRFRRADVGIYRSVYEMLQASGATRVTLRTSFRARLNIQRVINAAFEPAMRPVAGGDASAHGLGRLRTRLPRPDEASEAKSGGPADKTPDLTDVTPHLIMTGDQAALQASYVPLEPFRADAAEQPSVVVLPVPRPYATQRIAASAIEDSLPAAVGAFVEWLIHKSGWMVAERSLGAPGSPAVSGLSRGPVSGSDSSVASGSGPLPSPGSDSSVVSGFSRTDLAPTIARGFKPGEREQLVPIQARHVCLLFRRFVSYEEEMTRPYVEALEARGIPHLLVGGRSFHDRAEIETLRAALAAIEWPDDELSVFATLRGALFAISDEELLEYRHRAGHFHPFRIPTQLRAAVSQPSSVASGSGRTDAGTNAISTPSVVSGFSRTELARFAPIADALLLLQSWHRSRNRAPIATTIANLLKATRAHVRFALEHGGEQVLANVLHIGELARRYEAEGGISFRGFIDELRAQAEHGEAGEAPILEEGSDGVRLMTVHKAKGLEFPIVILADMTAKLRPSVASRYIDPDRRRCAIRLAGCSPVDLLQHEAEELQRDRAEGVRVAYVAATRARDLLVIPAVGDEARDGWIEPLNPAIYPPREVGRQQTPAPGCPPFRSKDSVLMRPNGDPAGPETVCPGLHTFGAIKLDSGGVRLQPDPTYSVVWWDPRALNLDAEPPLGIRHPELIVREVADHIVAAGMADYHSWRANREAALAAGSQPAIAVRTVTAWAQVGSALGDRVTNLKLPAVSIIELSGSKYRPSSRRFGTLVHAVLAVVPLDGQADVIKRLTATQGRPLGATGEEVDSAAEIVKAVLTHPLLQRAGEAARAQRCRREVPIAWREGDTALVEGVIDLAFEEETGWTVVDFKTGEELQASAAAYQRQVALYAAAVEAATGRPAAAVLVHV